MAFLDQIGADTQSGDLPPFIDRDAKHDLADNQHPFWLVGGVPHQEGKFEPQTFYYIRFGKPGKTTKTQTGEEITITAPGWAQNAESWNLPLTANDEREQQVKKVQQALVDPDTIAIGPVFLHRTTTKSGNDYWKIRGVRDESVLTKPANTNNKPAAADDDDGIPF